MSMFLSKVKLVMTAAAVVAALAAGAVALAQWGLGRLKDGTGEPQHVGSPSGTYHILVSHKGEPPRMALVEVKNDQDHPKIVLTSPQARDVALTQHYVCQIHAHLYINVRTLESGYLNEIKVTEGQAVKKGDLMFKIVPGFHKEKLAAQSANIMAPFDGLVGRLHEQRGSLIKQGDILTTLSDNSVIWAYFNVPETRYLEYMAARKQKKEDPKVELVLANGNPFPQRGKIGAIQAQFNSETGNISFRADFPNPNGLLRHGQTGTILLHRTLHDAVVIPQRATFGILDRRYVYVVDKDDVVHRREIVIHHELDDTFVIKRGVDVRDRIVLEGIRQVRDGEKVEYEFHPPEEVMRKVRSASE